MAANYRTFIISGAGGAGKSTIVDALLARRPGLWRSTSWTSREKRPTEADDAYVFVDRETFERERDRRDDAFPSGRFIEWVDFVGNYYGTPWPNPPEGRDAILVIELEGAQEVKRQWPDAVLVFVKAPSFAVIEQRMRERGDSAERVTARLEKARLEEALGPGIADHVIINDDLESAVAELEAILSGTA